MELRELVSCLLELYLRVVEARKQIVSIRIIKIGLRSPPRAAEQGNGMEISARLPREAQVDIDEIGGQEDKNYEAIRRKAGI